MQDVMGFDFQKHWDYENGFYLTSSSERLAKAIAQWEVYKKILHLPGDIVECGVYKGTSLIRFATFREITESDYSRKIIGFDAFGLFPDSSLAEDKSFISYFQGQGGLGISKDSLEEVFRRKGFNNFELVPGNILQTVPEYANSHPELKIALLHIDVDVYDPTVIILEQLFDRIIPGGLVVFDDYGVVHGETKAADEFFQSRGMRPKFEKLPYYKVPVYIRK